jgi:hypothetical protein
MPTGDGADLERELGALRATRRYRLACLIARPLDRLRTRHERADVRVQSSQGSSATRHPR